MDCADAEALAAFKHNIRDEWLARHLVQEKSKSMAALTTLMTHFCTGEDSWLAHSNNLSKNLVIRIPRTKVVGHVGISNNAALAATAMKTRQ